MSIMFPGFYTSEFVERTNAREYIREKCERLGGILREEIEKGARYNCKRQDVICGEDHCTQVAVMIVCELMDELPALRAFAHEDVHSAYDNDPAAPSLHEVVLSYPGLVALTIHRLAHFLYQRSVPFIPRMLSEYIHSITGIDINPGASIGRRVAIDHGTGVVIGETAIVGNDVSIYQGVTLGALSVAKDMQRKRHPTIEDGVTIYAGATILGGDTIVGQGSIIGGNVWIIESVPPYSKIYVESPRLICKNCNQDFGCSGDKKGPRCNHENRELKQTY